MIKEWANPIGSYLLGIFASDGCVHRNGRYVSLGQSGPYAKEYLEQVRDLVGIGKVYTSKENPLQHTLWINNPELSSFLQSHGIVPAKSLILRPSPLWDSWVEKPAFLRGLIDGDGCLGYYRATDKCYNFVIHVVGTEDLIRTIASDFPGATKVSKIKSARNCYQIGWNGRVGLALYKRLYVDLSLPVKSAKQFKYDGLQIRPHKLTVWEQLGERAQVGLTNGRSPMQLAKDLDIPFQTIYKWIQNGKLKRPG